MPKKICALYVKENPYVLAGFYKEFLEAKDVEIVESKFYHCKYRGQWREGYWVFGGIEQASANCFRVEVPDHRSESTNSHY